MPHTDDLIRLLQERSEHDRLPPGPALRERIARRRRLRAAGTTAAVVALVAAVALPVGHLRGDGHSVADPSPPPPPPTATATRPANAADRTPLEFTNGYRLADSVSSTLPAGNTFTYTFTPQSYDFELMLWCDSVSGSRVRAFVNGKQAKTDYCEPAGKRLEINETQHSRPVVRKQQMWQEDFGVQVGTPVTVMVKVHTGLDEDPDPNPPTAPGTARLLLYLPVAFTDFPLPEPPRTVPLLDRSPVVAGGTEINRVDALDQVTARDGNAVNGHYAFSVTRQAGRDISISLEANGPGVLRIVVDQRVEAQAMAFWNWNGLEYRFTIDPALLPVGKSVAVGVFAEHFTAPVWRVTAFDVEQDTRSGG